MKNRKVALVVGILGLVAAGCAPSSDSGTSSGAGTPGSGGTGGSGATNTLLVVNYISSRHGSVRSSFLAAEDSLSARLSAQGGYRSGAHYSQSADNYIVAIRGFLDDSTSYARTMSASLPVDRAAVAACLDTFKTEDVGYARTYYSNANWGLTGSSLTSVISDVQARVDSAYRGAVSMLP